MVENERTSIIFFRMDANRSFIILIN